MTIDEVLARIAAKAADLEIDEIKSLLDPFRDGMAVVSPLFDAGTFIYRGRRFNNSFNKIKPITIADLSYPPPHRAQLGRLNRSGESKFYASINKEGVFFELPDLQAGDEVALSFWKTTAQMFVNNIGYTDFVFRKLGASRPCPQWEPTGQQGQQTFGLAERTATEVEKILSQIENDALRELFSHYFSDTVNPTEIFKYKVTTAIGELHLGKLNIGGEFAGVLYPSIRMWANGDNLALLPWFVDRHLEFRKVMHVRIDSRSHNAFTITTLDCARSVDGFGYLRWQGGAPIWKGSLPAGATLRFEFKPDRDDDGDYIISAQGNPGHWSLN